MGHLRTNGHLRHTIREFGFFALIALSVVSCSEASDNASNSINGSDEVAAPCADLATAFLWSPSALAAVDEQIYTGNEGDGWRYFASAYESKIEALIQELHGNERAAAAEIVDFLSTPRDSASAQDLIEDLTTLETDMSPGQEHADEFREAWNRLIASGASTCPPQNPVHGCLLGGTDHASYSGDPSNLGYKSSSIVLWDGSIRTLWFDDANLIQVYDDGTRYACEDYLTRIVEAETADP